MTDEATERQTALPIESELAEAIGALSADAFEGGIAPSPEAGATVTPESRFAVLVEKTSYLDDAAAEKLKRAYEYASTAHKGVKRKSGEPYIIHPIEVALILSDLRMDVDTLCAALLHDTIEDTDTTAAALEEQFGAQVSQLVQGVTKITRIEVESLTDEQAATMRKMFVAMSKDIRVIVIKLADRLHNMRTLNYRSEEKQRSIALETMHVYAPLAHRLGIQKIKAELEQLALRYLDPVGYEEVRRDIEKRYGENKDFLQNAQNKVAERLDSFGFIARKKAEGRIRHVGLSFHDRAEVLDQILTEYPQIEVVQIQFNYLDYDDIAVQSRKCYEVCRKHGKPVLVMEPVKGGSLVNLPEEAKKVLDDLHGGSPASYAIRFAAGFPGMMMVLSGMSNMEQMKDNLSYMRDFKPLNETELAAVNKVQEIFHKMNMIPCTACRYCVEGCPKQISIPDLFAIMNIKQLHHDWNADYYYEEVHTAPGRRASDCLKCGKCEKICPQHLPIRKLLEEVAKEFDKPEA